MPALFEITFLPGGRKQRFAGSRGNYYRLDDGGQIDLHSHPVWCRRCSTISHGERIESVDDIDRQIAQLQDPSTLAYQMWTNNTFHEMFGGGEEMRRNYIDKVKKRRQWRERRISPPKCIICGSEDVFAFPLDEPVPNPEGSGTITVSAIGMCSTDFNEWCFTPEGERLTNGRR
jgi:hypothetical protein